MIFMPILDENLVSMIHIIHDSVELKRIRNNIVNNPKNWNDDSFLSNHFGWTSDPKIQTK
jgi:hypothetical protein